MFKLSQRKMNDLYFGSLSNPFIDNSFKEFERGVIIENNTKYVGGIKGDKKNGIGVLYYKNSSIKKVVGNFLNDKLVIESLNI